MSGIINGINSLNKMQATSTKVLFESISVPEIKQLFMAIKWLEKQPDYYNDADFRVIVKELRRNLYKFIGTLDEFKTVFDESRDSLNKQLKELCQYYEGILTTLITDFNLQENLKKLGSGDIGNPLVQYLFNLKTAASDEEIGLKAQSYNFDELPLVVGKTKDVEKYKDKFDEVVKLIKITDYRKLKMIPQKVIFLGTPSYFKFGKAALLFGKEITFLGMDFFNNRLDVPTIWEGNQSSNSTLMQDVSIIQPQVLDNEVIEDVDQSEIDAVSDEVIANIKYAIKNKQDKQKSAYQSVTIVTYQRKFLLIPAGGTLQVINFDDGSLNSQKIDKIQNGNVFLFKKHVMRNEIQKQAKEIIGKDIYRLLKICQDEWITKLRAKVESNMELACQEMRNNFGITTANLINLNLWINGGVIEPHEFKKILKYLSYDMQSIKDATEKMKKMKKAHNDAGREITNRMQVDLDKAGGISLAEEALEDGERSFSVNGIEYVLLRVKKIDLNPIEVEGSQLYKLHDIKLSKETNYDRAN